MSTVAASPGVIYAILHPTKEQIRYIGQAADYGHRKRCHLSYLKRGIHENRHLQNWFNKHCRGKAPPRFRVLQECLPLMVDECEREWIARGRAKGWKLCNVEDGGVRRGAISDSTRSKLAEISRRKWADPEYVKRWEAATAKRRGTPEQHAERDRIKEANRAKWRADMALAAARKANREAVPVPLTHKGTAFIALTRGMWAMIDVADWAKVNQHLWSAQRKGRYWRAKTNGEAGALVLLNRFIMGAKAGEMVPHLNGNQLDCRRANLALIQQNRGQPQNVARCARDAA